MKRTAENVIENLEFRDASITVDCVDTLFASNVRIL